MLKTAKDGYWRVIMSHDDFHVATLLNGHLTSSQNVNYRHLAIHGERAA